MFAGVSWTVVTIIVLSWICYTPAIKLGTGISQLCLGCICEVTSPGCNLTLGCNEYACGPLQITKGYWVDAGKPTLTENPSEDEDDDDAYRSCANNVLCAGRTVAAYMAKFRRDCDGNGIIDCDDYVRLHRFGVSGCTNDLNSVFESIYQMCTVAMRMKKKPRIS